MVIAVNNIIEAADYNGLQNAINNILGNGVGDRGYGQTLASSSVSIGSIIRASHLINLKADIESVAIHQTNALYSPALANVAVGGRILASDWLAYQNAITALTGTRFQANSNQMAIREAASYTLASSFAGISTRFANVTWTSADAARHWFNAGGEIRISPNVSNVTNSKGTAWATLVNSFRPMRFGYTSTTASAGTGTSIGWYDLTSSFQTIFSITGGATYSQNDIQVEALCNVANNNTGTASSLQLRITIRDDQSENVDEAVGATFTNSIQTYTAQASSPPTGATVTLPHPTVTI